MNRVSASLPFVYDHAVAIIPPMYSKSNFSLRKGFNFFLYRLDIWDNDITKSNDSRSSIIGFSSIGGICSSNQYSIIEFGGLNSIENAAHELGHK